MKIALIALTCASLTAIDGDTVKCDGMAYRLLGYDTPELRGKCARERRLARKAKARLSALLTSGWPELVPAGRRGRWGRPLAWLYVDGRDVAGVMIGEGLARPYSGGKRKEWC